MSIIKIVEVLREIKKDGVDFQKVIEVDEEHEPEQAEPTKNEEVHLASEYNRVGNQTIDPNFNSNDPHGPSDAPLSKEMHEFTRDIPAIRSNASVRPAN